MMARGIVILCSSQFFFFKQKTAYEMRISDWSSDVCSSDLAAVGEFDPSRLGNREIGAFADDLRAKVAGVGSKCIVDRVADLGVQLCRSEERRVGKECVSTC